ncbi:MAG: tRNA (adenosine(37)-N6)-threonylcarbamoyltransferase complex transferase subunit TsaD [Patescibacteria group bacterium]|nr:tRNA (adenosine(37)-N6)-threonylcarbamoyltransferase complex transferase subunit TsaD [Patescibacteria group bacterium]
MIILGIETSCDETALALIETRGSEAGMEMRVIESLVHSQAGLHSAYGGVYPTLAKREHGKNLVPLLGKLLEKAGMQAGMGAGAPEDPGVRGLSERSGSGASSAGRPETAGAPAPIGAVLESFREEIAPQNPELFETFAAADFLKGPAPAIGRIAVTEGPGLEPALWTGINLARMLGALWGVPIVPIDHMEGHIVGSLVPSDAANGAWQRLHDAPMPAVALLISGGHTELVKVARIGSYEILGATKDDAVGEAFDKTARLLGLPYPGGPHIAELAHKAWEEGIPAPVALPRPMISSGDLGFSFSGLKTAALYAVRAAARGQDGALPDAFKKGLAREFESAVSDVLSSKLAAAIEAAGAGSVIVGGGVSANHALRRAFQEAADRYGIPLFMPSRHISGDNALMIAVAGAFGSSGARSTTPGSLRASGTKRLS